jgi:hypothetical protein
VPTWTKVAIDAWTAAAAISAGPVFRPVNHGDQAQEAPLNEKVIWQLLRPYATAAGVFGIAPHDCRRYAESRIMPNRLRCGHVCMGLDIAGCGIVLAMPVLRVGMCDSIQPNCAVSTTIEHMLQTPAGRPLGRAGRTMQMAADSEKLCSSACGRIVRLAEYAASFSRPTSINRHSAALRPRGAFGFGIIRHSA